METRLRRPRTNKILADMETHERGSSVLLFYYTDSSTTARLFSQCHDHADRPFCNVKKSLIDDSIGRRKLDVVTLDRAGEEERTSMRAKFLSTQPR
jgi:hypothetical protein